MSSRVLYVTACSAILQNIRLYRARRLPVSMLSKISNIKAHVRRWGWARTIYHAIMRGAAEYLGVHVCAVRTRAAAENPQLPCTLPGIDFRKVETHELLEASEDGEFELDRDFVSEAIVRGDIAFGAFDQDVLVAYTWRTMNCAPHTDKLWVRVASPYNYSYKSFARAGYRGQRIAPSLLLFSDAEMLKLGCTHRAGIVAVTNFPSLELGKHMASEVIGYGAFAAYFGRCFSFRSRALVNIGLDFITPRGR